MIGGRMRAALLGALVAPVAFALVAALPFAASLVLPRGDAPSPMTELLVEQWRWAKYAAGAAWGIALALLTGRGVARLGAAGLLGMAAGDAVALGPLSAALAPLFVDRPPHVEMATTFPLAIAVVVATMGLAFAIAAGDLRGATVLSLAAAAAAGAVMALAIAALDALGVRTGTGALAMPKVAVLGTAAAASVVGAIQAAALHRAVDEERAELRELDERARA